MNSTKTDKLDTTRGRTAFVTYCDDIRQEVGNKISLMGCYSGQMNFPILPATLPKLCAHVMVSTPIEKPFKKLIIKFQRDDEILGVSELSFEELAAAQQAVSAEAGAEKGEGGEYRFHASTAFMLGNLQIDGPCQFKTVIETEKGRLKGNGLEVRQAPHFLERLSPAQG